MLAVRDVHAAYDETEVLRGINLNVAQGEILCLLGPSGCGKTTLLRVIAGLERPAEGDVQINNQSIVDIPVHKRGFGLMFQEYALFPHMNIEKNVTFGLRMRGMSKSQQTQRAREVLDIVGMSGFEGRGVAQLSGGERQRVALARSLAPNPHLLMLDEPLGSLDASLSERLVIDIKRIIKRVGLTAIYVTHDQQEAFIIGDRIAIMNNGMVEQIDKPEMIYHYPKTVFVAEFLGLNNIIPVIAQEAGTVTTPVGEFPITVAGEACAVLLHPEGLRIVPQNTPGAIPGTIKEQVFLGNAYRLEIALNDTILLTVSLPAGEGNAYSAGTPVGVMAEVVIPLC